jgi:DNA-binding NtrC family response regulator
MIAKAIHNISGKEGKFVSVNLANSTPELARSELFGHTKGAFTDAKTEREGFVGSAKGGTLFIDELGNAPTEIFPLLLQLVEEKTYQRMGDNKTFELDARIIVSSNKELEPLIEKGVFPRDLYYRIKNVPIYLPSLKQRPEDLELFVNHFVAEFLQPGQPFKVLSADVMEAMRNYDWPGNIRELRGEIEHACGRSKNEKLITFQHLEKRLRDKLTSISAHGGQNIDDQRDTGLCFPSVSNLPSDFSSRKDDEIAEQLNPYGHTDFTIQGEHLITLMRALLYFKGAIDPASKLLKRAGFRRNSGVERIKNALGKNGQKLVVDEFQKWYFKSFPGHSLTRKLKDS